MSVSCSAWPLTMFVTFEILTEKNIELLNSQWEHWSQVINLQSFYIKNIQWNQSPVQAVKALRVCSYIILSESVIKNWIKFYFLSRSLCVCVCVCACCRSWPVCLCLRCRRGSVGWFSSSAWSAQLKDIMIVSPSLTTWCHLYCKQTE